MNDSYSHIWNSFFENIISSIQRFYICPDFPVDIIRVFLISYFLAESLKANKNQQKRPDNLQYSFSQKNLIHFSNLNSPDTENNMLPQHSQKPFWLYKFSSKHISVLCQKKYLHCTISWRTKTAFLKHFESKCLYISIYLLILEIQFFILIEIFENSTIF